MHKSKIFLEIVNPFLSNKGHLTPDIVLCEGKEFITGPQHVAYVNHGFATVADHIGDATAIVINGNTTMQDIVKH